MDILLVEDDDAIALPLTQGLVRAGFRVERVASVADALSSQAPDILLLDLGLPDGDGLDVARAFRSRSDLPILILSARGEELDQVVGLEVGADDYLVKPFGVRELVARIRAVQRRMTPPGTRSPEEVAAETTTIANVVVDRRAHRVTLDGKEVELTPKEFGIVEVLTRDVGAAVSREAILEEVWGHAWYGPTRTIDVHVAAIRRKLGHAGWVQTVRGVGFRFATRRPEAGQHGAGA